MCSGLNGVALRTGNHVGTRLNIVENEVGIEVRIAHFKAFLLRYTRKATTHFEQVFRDMRNQLCRSISFSAISVSPIISNVRVFRQIVSQVA